MHVKGTAFLARKMMIERMQGAERFEVFLRAFAETEPVFIAPVLPTSRLPMSAFMAFNQALIDTFFAGDAKGNFRLGEESATWALTGPYKQLVNDRSVGAFVAAAPAMYRNYYDEGEARSGDDDGVIFVELMDIRAPYRSLYIEYGVMGYFRRGLEMVSGRQVAMSVVRGFSLGHDSVRYEFRIGRISIRPPAAP